MIGLRKDVLKGYKELAQYLGIGQDTARKLMHKPDFPVVTVSERIRLIDVDALNDWLRSQQRAT